jgi:transposase-like protein
MTGKKKRTKSQNRYPEELKRKIAKEYLAGEASYGILAEEHGLANKGVVKEFVKWYRKKYELSDTTECAMPKNKESAPAVEEQTLQQQIKELKRQLALSELKVESLETMIDIAEDELKINIRKKSGAKQSRK